MITDRQRLVNSLQAAIDAMLLVIDLELKITGAAQQHPFYKNILDDMRCKLDGETALLRGQEVLGR
jgi:hypothetical protein